MRRKDTEHNARGDHRMTYICKQREIALTDEDILKYGCLGSQKVSGIGDCINFEYVPIGGVGFNSRAAHPGQPGQIQNKQ